MGMGRFCHAASIRFLLVAQVALALAEAGLVYAQGIQPSPYSTSSMVRGLSGEGLTPPSLFGAPGSAAAGSDTVSISSGMFQGLLPPIPNLQVGYIYNFGPNVRSGRATADYFLPVKLGAESGVFGEAHTEWQSFWKAPGFNNRVDVSLGGGYRTLLRNKAMVGVNGFYDTSRLGELWYSSGSVGFETAALLSGSDALDLRANWYGKLFNSSVIVDAFRYGPSNYDFQAGFSHELWNGGPDFRVSATGYQFDVGNRVYGWNTGAELKSRDGVFVVKYAVGRDPINSTYQTVAAFVNVGFRMENILRGESPFIMPQPIFNSPRSILTWLDSTLSTLRNFSQPASALIAQQVAIAQGVPNGPTPPPGAYVIYGPATIVDGTFFTPTPPVPAAAWPAYKSVTVTWTGVLSPAPGPGVGGIADVIFGDPNAPPDANDSTINKSAIVVTTSPGSAFAAFNVGGGGSFSGGAAGSLALSNFGGTSIVIGPGGFVAFQFY